MAASGVVCRSSRVLVIDMNRAFNLACFVAAGPCNKGLSQNQQASPFSSQIPKASWARRLHHCRRLSSLDKPRTSGLLSDTPSPELPTAAGAGAGGEVTVEYYRGLPQVTVPLPSRRERCRFTLRPVSNTVGDFLAMLRHEDHGIDRVAVSSLDDVRIASSNTIEVLMENDFKLIVNDSVYVVNTPRQERLTQEELQRLSDVRNLVNQMYEALNVEEHQLHKERELCSQLEELKVELEPMEQKRQELEQIASRRTNILTWVGLGLMSVQFGILARLTWWEYSWDIMEPVTYFVTYGTAMAAYAYFVLTRQEYLLPDVKDRQHLIILHKRARKVGLDLGRYNQLKDSIAQLEADLRRLRDPLQLHLPPHHLSSARSRPGAGADATEPRSPLERAQAHIRSLLQRGRSATRGST